MASKRQNDTDAQDSRFRSERMIKQDGNWFFETREGTFEGPFGSKSEAEEGLERYIYITNMGLLKDADHLALDPL
ncbi:MAG: DUF6316 family protein [Halioglobus sp.]|nr:DUF6316 family protein [Halioglobus sp.]